jgi:hypothetical protein
MLVKCAAVRSDLFAVAMLAQTICAIAQAFTLGIPARLSALWLVIKFFFYLFYNKNSTTKILKVWSY